MKVSVRASISGESVAIGTCRRPSSGEIAVDLVGDDQTSRRRAGGRHALELRPLEHAPRRGVGVAEQECAGALTQRPRERVEVHRVAAVGAARERVLVTRETVIARGAQDGRVDRRLHEQPSPGR